MGQGGKSSGAKAKTGKTKASGAKAIANTKFTQKVGNRLVLSFEDGTTLSYEFAGKGRILDEFNELHNISDIPGGINGIIKQAKSAKILPPQKSTRNIYEDTPISKEASRASRLYRKSKAPGARHFSL